MVENCATLTLKCCALKPAERELRAKYYRQKQECREEGVEKKYGYNGIAPERAFLSYVVEAEEQCREKGRSYPHTTRLRMRNVANERLAKALNVPKAMPMLRWRVGVTM